MVYLYDAVGMPRVVFINSFGYLSYSLPVKMLAVEGFKQKVVRFTTDIPHLGNWGQPLLLGPGSILVAHTKDEFVLKKDLDTAASLYSDLVYTCLTERKMVLE